MLNIGFSELLLIAILALAFIGPKELPVVMRHIAKFLREIQSLGDDVKRQMQEVVKDTGVDGLRSTTILDLEGKPQQAYDVADLEALRAAPAEKPAAKPTEQADG